MMRSVALACAMLAATAQVSTHAAEAAASAPVAGTYNSASTEIGTLIDDPASRAVLDKFVPGMTQNPQIEMARSMTLKQVQAFVPDMLSDAVLGQVDEALAKLAPKGK